jgi:hypothetical protein
METVICRNCGTSHEVEKSITCKTCNEEILSQRAILDAIKEKQAKSDTLQAEIAMLRSELFFRKQRKTETWFYEMSKPTFKVNKTEKKKQEVKITVILSPLNFDDFI